jgi:hypothetical protein
MLLIITFISWIGALGTAKFLRMTVIRGETTPFVMELPPYRIPTLKGLFIHTWERTWQYIKKAGTVILGISILVWAMMTYPLLSPEKEALFETERQEILATYALPDSSRALNYEIPTKELSPEEEELRKDLFALEGLRAETALENSVAGRMGKGIEKITRWAGFDWRTNIALVGGSYRLHPGNGLFPGRNGSGSTGFPEPGTERFQRMVTLEGLFGDSFRDFLRSLLRYPGLYRQRSGILEMGTFRPSLQHAPGLSSFPGSFPAGHAPESGNMTQEKF